MKRKHSSTGAARAALRSASTRDLTQRLAQRRSAQPAKQSGQLGRLQRGGRSLYLHCDGVRRAVILSSDLPEALLLDRLLRWDVLVDCGQVRVTPIECHEIVGIRRHWASATRPVRLLPVDRLGPTAPGASELERIQDGMDQVRRIQELSETKDDPVAWAALANGYRIKRLRLPLERAMGAVGWRQLLTLLDDHPGEWPLGLRSFLLAEQRKWERSRSNGELANAAARRGDYGTLSD